MTSHAPVGRPRRPETEQRITDAALALLRTQGPGAVNVASVSARSGVARTTVYRRYRDRTELLRAVLAGVTDQGAPPPESSARDKLVWVLTRTREVVSEGIGVGGVAAVLAGTDPEFNDALRDALAAGLEPILAQLGDDVAAGRVAAHTEPEIVVDVAFGAWLAELVRHREPDPAWVDRTADLLAAALAPR
ncbi:TetR/AcrR family transcriptional regulator [Nocardioides solisilvae]|uniref:TetR/AcrR family transcriptional regulator n=1 Tax=Nocardioides solisilvae TaxID=1542435 RepID=UPI0013A585C9|nr:TetR/AcrR family transcriptional regulator [Nocardioides solisilvae]